MSTPYARPTDPAKRHSHALTDGPDRGKEVVLERERAVEIADHNGIALVGVAGDRDGEA